MAYVLTIGTPGGQTKERWEAESFNLWCAVQGEKISATFTGRRDQFRRFTNQNVVDWEMEDD